MLKLKHKSAVRSRDSGGASYREIYYGTREEVEDRSRAPIRLKNPFRPQSC